MPCFLSFGPSLLSAFAEPRRYYDLC